MGRVGQATAVLLGVVASAGARAETYEDAWRAAQAGPETAAARARYLASTAQVGIAKASGRPKLTVDISASRVFDTDVYGPRLRDSTTVQLELPIYAGGRVSASIMEARADQDAAREEVAAADLRLAVDVADAYADVRQERALGATAAEEIERLGFYARRIGAERRAGLLDVTDAAECRERLAAARHEAVDARRREADAAARFEQVVGRPPAADLAPMPVLPLDVDDPADAVRDGNPELRGLRDAVRAATAEVSAQRGRARPTLSLVAAASYGNTGDGLVDQSVLTLPGGYLARIASPPRFPHRFGATGLLTFSMPITRGGEITARVAQARATQREAEARVQSREAALLATARQALARARAALEGQELARATLEDSREALRGLEAARSIGDRSEHDVLIASAELADAGRRRARAEHDAAVQGVVALAAMGRMPGRGEAELDIAPSRSSLASVTFDLALLPGSTVTSGLSGARSIADGTSARAGPGPASRRLAG